MPQFEQKPGRLPELPAREMAYQVNYNRRHYQVWVENHITLADIARPAFWVHHQEKVKPGDVIEVLSRDLLLEAHLRVIKSENKLVVTRPTFVFEDATRKSQIAELQALAAGDETRLPATPVGYTVGFSPKGGYWVKLQATQSIIADKKANKRLAIDAAIEHAKAAGTYEPPAEHSNRAA